jgi:hypothetical protein
VILHGFTANQEKELLLDSIRSSRSLIKVFSNLIKGGSSVCDRYHEFIAHEQAQIKRNMAKLVELERFRLKERLDPDEKYILPTVKAAMERRKYEFKAELEAR